MRFRKMAPGFWGPAGGEVRLESTRARSTRVSGKARAATRVQAVREYLDAYFSGDLARARRMVTADYTADVRDEHGRAETLVGFDAGHAFVSARWGVGDLDLRFKLFDFLAADDQVCVVFEERHPHTTGDSARQLSLWSFRGDLIASTRIYGPSWSETAPAAGPAGRSAAAGLVSAFAHAWIADDLELMRSLCHPSVTCRWIGFGPSILEATGVDDIVRAGKSLERGVSGRLHSTRVLDHLDGRDHVALLLESDPDEPGPSYVGLGLYRIMDDRVASLTVYAHRRA